MQKANNNKKCAALLSSAALGVLIASAVTTSAHAAVTSYIVKDATDPSKVISFGYNDLLASYTAKLSGAPSPMFDAYLTDAANLIAFQDSVKGYVDATAVENAYTQSISTGTQFDVDNFTENASPANIVTGLTVGYTAGTDGTITPVAQAPLAVQSVSALNVKQVKVTFNNAVDKTSAETATNYTLNGTALTSADIAKLQSDGKSVVITLSDARILGVQSSNKLDVANVIDASGNVMTASTGNAFTVLDTAVPQAQSATLVSPTQVKVTFSAPIQPTTAPSDYLIDNGQYSIATAVPTAADDSVLLTLGTALPSGAHSLVIAPSTSNTAPKAYNGLAAVNTTLNFNAAADTTAPTVSVANIKLMGTSDAPKTQVQFKFSKPVALNTSHFYYGYDKGTAVGQLTNGADDTTGIDASANKVTIGSTTYADTYDVVFNGAIPTGASTFYVDNDADVTTGSTSYAQDAWANKFVSTSVVGNFVMDTTKPTATSVVMNGQTKIDVTFSKAVSNATSGVNYVLKDSQGNVVTPATLSGASLDYSGHPTTTITNVSGNEYEINLGTSLKAGTYTLTVSGVQDTVLPVANTMDSKSYTLTVADTTAPVVNKVTYNTAKTKLFVYYSKAMTISGTGSIVDTVNYQLNGAALPTGTTISTMNNNEVAVITLPTAQTSFTSLTVGGVKDSLGNTIGNLAQTIDTAHITADGISSTDIVAGSAKAIANDTVTFEVDQPLSGINASAITVNGTAGSVSYNNQMVNNGTEYGALVTVKAGTPFGTSTSTLNVALGAAALTNINGGAYTIAVANTPDSIGTIADKVAPLLSTAKVTDTTTSTDVTGTVSADDKNVTVDLTNTASNDQLNTVNVALSEDATISIPTLTINGVTIPAQTKTTTSGSVTISLANLAGITDNGNNGVSETKLKQLAGASDTISLPVTLIDNAGNVTSGTVTIKGLH